MGWCRKMFHKMGPPRDNLFVAVALTALGLAIFGVVAWWLIGFALTGNPTYSLPKSTETRGDATRVALTIVAGLGGAVALVVTYRKQKRAEVPGHRLPSTCHSPEVFGPDPVTRNPPKNTAPGATNQPLPADFGTPITCLM